MRWRSVQFQDHLQLGARISAEQWISGVFLLTIGVSHPQDALLRWLSSAIVAYVLCSPTIILGSLQIYAT